MFELDLDSYSEPVKLILEKINNWAAASIKMLPNFLVAVLTLIAFIIIARIVRRILTKLLDKTTSNLALQNLLIRIGYFAIIAVGLFAALGILELDKTVTSLLAGVGVIGLALGFAFQDIASNFISGVILAVRSPINIGDIIEVSGHMGTVTDTNLRVTSIKTFQGQEVFIPNSTILQDAIVNYTTYGKRRIDLAVGVSYGEDLRRVKKVVLETIDKMQNVIDPQNTIFAYTGFGGSSIDFEIKFWIDYPDHPSFLDMRSEAIMSIKEAFDNADIMIPYPIRTLDFGIKGGEKLSEMKLNLLENQDNSQREID
ncbi:mechanosensitive ion channel family protein [Arcticibacterium luteifluviistationis]|uniref:Mechanosensitive ion channel protein MscS n=1 Tax=Arcticibacterium luteifluviistationis TaxID=1784714 RepID=A0A2Z4GFB3_9BACT|nr:mechanosensitive ion channel family protein [Arcticibacterium luteifluviistationis]AWV99920.1 mechanosensitive ion channel protein MscS [Arcticibacterium luteifluviistationis]